MLSRDSDPHQVVTIVSSWEGSQSGQMPKDSWSLSYILEIQASQILFPGTVHTCSTV